MSQEPATHDAASARVYPLDIGADAEAVRRLAITDAGAATALAHHLAARDVAFTLGGPEAVRDGGRFAVVVGGAEATRDEDGSSLPPFTLADRRLSGRQALTGGGALADRFLILLPPDANGIAHAVTLGQSDPRVRIGPIREDFGLAGAGIATLELDAWLAANELTAIPATPFALALDRYTLRLEHLHLVTVEATLAAFFEQALAFLRTRSRPWFGTGLERAGDDPHVIRALGQEISRLHALQDLTEQATASVEAALGAGRPAEAFASLDLARHYADRIAREAVSETIGLLGASATSGRHGFDRPWRDLAIHGLRHRPRRDPEALGRDIVARILARDAIETETEARSRP
jgi:hypothetical protein